MAVWYLKNPSWTLSTQFPTNSGTLTQSSWSHWITAIIDSCVLLLLFLLLLFCSSLCRLRFAHRRKGGKVNIELGHIELGPTSTTFPSQEGSLKVQSIQTVNRAINHSVRFLLFIFFKCFSLLAASTWCVVALKVLKHWTKHTDGLA